VPLFVRLHSRRNDEDLLVTTEARNVANQIAVIMAIAGGVATCIAGVTTGNTLRGIWVGAITGTVIWIIARTVPPIISWLVRRLRRMQ
jgi:hypothetical protein